MRFLSMLPVFFFYRQSKSIEKSRTEIMVRTFQPKISVLFFKQLTDNLLLQCEDCFKKFSGKSFWTLSDSSLVVIYLTYKADQH